MKPIFTCFVTAPDPRMDTVHLAVHLCCRPNTREAGKPLLAAFACTLLCMYPSMLLFGGVLDSSIIYSHADSSVVASVQAIEALVCCHADHAVAKFWGVCNEQKWALDACLREEKAVNQCALKCSLC